MQEEKDDLIKETEGKENSFIIYINKNPIKSLFYFIGLLFGWTLLILNVGIGGWFDLSGKGTIGDAVGGITAPIINLLSVVLLYMSLKSQIDANKIQNTELNRNKISSEQNRNMDLILNLFFKLENDYSNIEFMKEGVKHKGMFAINFFIQRFRDTKTQEEINKIPSHLILSQLTNFSLKFIILSQKIKESNLSSNDRKLVCLYIRSFYVSSYGKQVHRLINLCNL